MQQRGPFVSHQPLDIPDGRAVAAHHPMPPQQPHVARPGRRLLWRLGHLVGIGQAFGFPHLVGQQLVQAVGVKAQQVQVEVSRLQIGQLQAQHGVVPAGVQRDLVVCDDVGPPLGRRQARQAQAWHVGHAQALRGHDAPVTGHDAALLVNQHRVGETELAHAGRDLRQLFVAVGA